MDPNSRQSICVQCWVLSRPDRYVPMFGEKIYDPLKWRESVPIVEQLQALKKVIDQGKVWAMLHMAIL